MGGKSLIICGARGMGKSTFVKNALEKVPLNNRFIYDVNAEYLHLYNKPLLPFGEFVEQASKLKNAVICFEEATIFLNNKGSNMQLVEILVRLRHTNNTCFLVFHSLRSIPRYVFDLCTHLVLFKTNDNISQVEKRFENELLSKAFLSIKNSPMLVNQQSKKEYSPCKIISLQ